jgi:predicted acetyltransferase
MVISNASSRPAPPPRLDAAELSWGMHVELVPATPHDEPVLGRLLQLYAYDFSEIAGMDVGDDALFDLGHTLSRCFGDPKRHAYLARVHRRLAGFVLVDEQSRLDGNPDVMDVAEFFVMRRYRRTGVGFACARQVFLAFPRRWEVRQTSTNTGATAFWRDVIGRFTRGAFQQTLVDDDRWRGPVLSFDASAFTASGR